MMQLVPIEEALERLEEYVARGGMGAPPSPYPRGWLIQDIRHVCAELRTLADKPKSKPQRTWAQVWGLFDRRKK